MRALLVRDAGFVDVHVGGIALSERWDRALGFRGIPFDRVSPHELPARMAAAADSGGLFVFWEDRVVDNISLDDLIDFAVEGACDSPLTFRHPKLGIAPMLYAPGGSARDAAAGLREGTPEAVLAAAERHGLQAMELTYAWWGRVGSRQEASAANWGLLRRLRWRQGGFIAHYLNRPVSMVISRALIHTPLSPNQSTILTFLIGIVGIWFVLQPGYANAALGMLLMHINSVFDGIDGELAHMRYQRSSFGAYLDSVCDELLNTALCIAAGYHVTITYHPGTTLYLWLGAIAGTGSMLYALAHWHCKAKHGMGLYWWLEADKPRKSVQRSNSAFAYFKRMFQKDGLLFLFFAFSLIGYMEPMLWVAAIGSSAVVVLLFIHVFIKRARW